MYFCTVKYAMLLFSLLMLRGYAQSTQADWQELARQWMTAEDVDEGFGDEAMLLLEELAATPLNLNEASREQLEQLPFLTALQVDAVATYLEHYRPLRSLSELQMVKALDNDTRQLLACFVYVGDEPPQRVWPRLSDVARHGRHRLTATVKVPLYEHKGDRNGYLGYKYRHDVRYQFSYGDRIKAGITGAQDAGEPFLSNRNSLGYDHYSYYVQLRDMGRLEELNLGMFRVQMGMGLLMNTAFSLGKLASLQSMGRSSHQLTAHTTRSAAGYLQGAAATVRLRSRWRVTLFASYRPIDATLNDDGTARTLLTGGYHRTPTEMGKKHNTHELCAGTSVGWLPALREGRAVVHLNAVYSHLDRRLVPQKSATSYRRYAVEGNHFVNVSLDYSYTRPRMAFSGETAVNGDGAIAAIHTASYRLTDYLTLMALHRYYDKRYTALHARSFGEGSGVQNEHGLYVGATWRPTSRWLLQGYADYAHFAWKRYQVSAPSDAFDGLLTVRYNRRRWTLEGRYRLHIRQRDNSSKTLLENRPDHRLRLRAAVDVSAGLTLQTQADGANTLVNGRHSSGVMVSQRATWRWRNILLDGQVGWFHTDDYNSRLYQYERSVAHDFSFPMYYGHGIRYSLLAQATFGRRLSISAKAATTDYFDRTTIGTGLQSINHSAVTDILLQATVKL